MGGPSTLTNTIANHLKNKVEINAHVQEIIHNQDFVTVKYQQNGTEFVETAKYAIITTPAPITRKITKI